uniref:Uncharacterized protein n=1 Tax=Panstrongylus lignarius TaxID=156445 RepID=A0A224Y0Y2_9HEMI
MKSMVDIWLVTMKVRGLLFFVCGIITFKTSPFCSTSFIDMFTSSLLLHAPAIPIIRTTFHIKYLSSQASIINLLISSLFKMLDFFALYPSPCLLMTALSLLKLLMSRF